MSLIQILHAFTTQIQDLGIAGKYTKVWISLQLLKPDAPVWCHLSSSLTSPVRTQKQFFVFVYDVMERAVSSIPLCLFVPTSDFLS